MSYNYIKNNNNNNNNKSNSNSNNDNINSIVSKSIHVIINLFIVQ